MASLQPSLVRRSMVCAGIFIVQTIFFGLMVMQVHQVSGATAGVRWTSAGSCVVGVFLWIIFLAYSACLLRRGFGNPFRYEYVTVFLAAFILLSLPLRSVWYLMKFRGLDLEDCPVGGHPKGMPLDAQERLVLRMVIVLTAATFLPLRVQVAWMLPFTARVIFLAAAFLGSQEGSSSIGNGFNLFLLCSLCHLGDRRQEQQVREKWKAQNTVEQSHV